MKCNLSAPCVALGRVIMGAVVCLGLGNRGFAAETVPPVQPAYQQLLSTKLFAFGGIGFAGTISEGEKAFHTLAAGANALQFFAALLKSGSAEAQMYGLCGIRKLAPQTFAAQAKSFLSANTRINTMSGCIGFEEPASNIVARIAAGSYDADITNAQIIKSR